MPYKLSDDKKAILILRGSKWKVLKRHRSPAQALAHFRALKANVKH